MNRNPFLMLITLSMLSVSAFGLNLQDAGLISCDHSPKIQNTFQWRSTLLGLYIRQVMAWQFKRIRHGYSKNGIYSQFGSRLSSVYDQFYRTKKQN